MKSKLIKHIGLLLAAALSFSAVSVTTAVVSSTSKNNIEPVQVNADAGTYYNDINDSDTGTTLLSALHTLNNKKRTSTVGYGGIRTFAATCDADPDGSGKIIGFYDNAKIGPSWDQGKTWNREHVWPDARGGSLVEGDAHMVRPAATSTNSGRGSKGFGTQSFDPGSSVAFYRGVSARIIFYSAIANTSLKITDDVFNSDYKSSDPANTMGTLSDLLRWNLQYLPTDTSFSGANDLARRTELSRNEKIQTASGGQGNRNPFIDHPEYACRIWGNTNSSTKQICGSSSSTPSISVTANKTSIAVDGTATLTATTQNAGTPTITWSVTSGSSYVTLSASTGSSITVTGKSAGKATIQASMTVDSTPYTASKEITVTDSGSGGGSGDYKITFATASSDGSTVLDTDGLESLAATNTLVSSFTNATKCYAGKSGVKLGSSSAIGSFTATPVSDAQTNVSSITIKSTKYSTDTGTLTLSVNGSPVKSNITPGVDATYTPSSPISVESFQIATSSKRAYVGEVLFTVGGSVTPTPEKVLDSISAVYNGSDITIGDSLTKSDIVVTAHYTDSYYSDETLDSSEWTYDGFDSSTTGDKTVTIYYGDESTTVTVTVIDVPTPVPYDENAIFKKITQISDIDTNTYVIAANNSGTYKAMQNSFSTKINADTINVDSNGIITTSDLSGYIVTITKSGDNVTISTGSTYLTYSSSTNLGTSNSPYNWTISSGTKGTFRIASTSTSNRGVIFRASTYNVFGGYSTTNVTASGTEYYDVELFRLNKAAMYSEEFLAAFTCDSTGKNAPTFKTGYSWSVLKTKYSSLPTIDKTTLQEASANENGTTIEQAMARYDYVVHKYAYENYISRTSSGIIIHNALSIDSSTATIIIIATSMAAITIIGGALILKRKEQ